MDINGYQSKYHRISTITDRSNTRVTNKMHEDTCCSRLKVRTCLKLFDRRNFTKHVRERIRRMRRKKTHDKCVHTENNELKILQTV